MQYSLPENWKQNDFLCECSAKATGATFMNIMDLPNVADTLQGKQ